MVLAEDRSILFANQAALECFEYDANDISWMAFGSLVSDIEQGPDEATYNATGRTKTGKSLFLDVQCNDWVTHDGDPRTTAIIRNLSIEIAAISELKKTKTLSDLALAGSRIEVFDVNLATESSEVSDTWCEIMGYDPSQRFEDTQQLLFARVHPEDLHILRDADLACIKGETPRSISEFRVLFPENSWRWMRSDAVIVEWDQLGEAVRMIGTQSDVTQLRHARNALEQSESQFRQVVSAAPIGMALMSSSWAFHSVNQAFSDLFGYGDEHHLERAQLSDIMPLADFDELSQKMNSMVAENDKGVYRGEYRLRQKTGEVRWGFFTSGRFRYPCQGRDRFRIEHLKENSDPSQWPDRF
jgi:PAS domain S-box-containing protein